MFTSTKLLIITFFIENKNKKILSGTLPADVHIVKAMVFPAVMYGCQSWTAEHRRIDALNCGVGEDSWESLGLQGDPTSPS